MKITGTTRHPTCYGKDKWREGGKHEMKINISSWWYGGVALPAGTGNYRAYSMPVFDLWWPAMSRMSISLVWYYIFCFLKKLGIGEQRSQMSSDCAIMAACLTHPHLYGVCWAISSEYAIMKIAETIGCINNPEIMRPTICVLRNTIQNCDSRIMHCQSLVLAFPIMRATAF